MPSALPTAEAPALAETLLAGWEAQARPVRGPAYYAARPAVLALLTGLCATLLGAGLTRVDIEDARDVLARAEGFGIGTATATGADRATRLVEAALAASRAHRLGRVRSGRAHYALLSLRSRTDTPLAMDELTYLLSTLQAALGPHADIVFGHDETADADAPALQLWLLVGYGGGP